MPKRIWTLGLLAALAVLATMWLPDAAEADVFCGDGVVQVPEECDDGDTETGDGCSFPSCLPEECGDTIVNPDPPGLEECDDGGTTDDDGCTDTCQDDCGDGETDAGLGEICDDGNETNGDDCDDDVSTDPQGNCTPTACGNGVITGDEFCDDGNTVDGDGCPADCTIENFIIPKPYLVCINAINKNLAGVIKAQHADNATCVKDVASMKQLDTGACLGTDLKGKVGKAQDKTTATDAKKCQPPKAEPPTFAYTGAATVNDAGEMQALEAAAEVLGATPNVVLKSADEAGAACQAEVMKQLGAVSNKWAAEANKAKKSALKGSKTVPPAASGIALASAIDTAVGASTSLTGAETKATTRIGKKCTDGQLDALFDCGDATTVAALSACVIDSAERAACEALEAADDLALTCP